MLLEAQTAALKALNVQGVMKDLEWAVDLFGAKPNKDLAFLSQNVESTLALGLKTKLEAAYSTVWAGDTPVMSTGVELPHITASILH